MSALDDWIKTIDKLREAASKIPPAPVEPVKEVTRHCTANSIPVGGRFSRKDERNVFIRLAPRSFLLNSKLVSEAMAEGKVLIANLDSGSCYFIRGDEVVFPYQIQ